MSPRVNAFLVLANLTCKLSLGFIAEHTYQRCKWPFQSTQNDDGPTKLPQSGLLVPHNESNANVVWEVEPREEDFEELDSFEDMSLENQTITTLTLEQLTESFAANVSYFYLRDELGLSDEALWRVTYEASSVLGIKTAVIRKKVQVLQDMMDLTMTDLRELITLQPSILHLSAERNLAPTMLYLIRSLDLGKADLRKLVLKCPCLLSYGRTNLRAKLAFFLRLMKYSVEETRELLMDEPRLIRCSVHGSLIPHLRFFLGNVKLSQSDLRLVVQKNPRLLLYNIERNLYLKVNGLNMTTIQTQKVLKTFPKFYDYSMARTIVPVIHYLVDDLGFEAEQVRNIMVRFPRIVSYKSSLKNKVGFFRYEIGLSPDTVRSILMRTPGLVGVSTDTSRARIDYYKKRLDLNQDEIRKVIGLMPSLLTLNLERNVDPKIEYLSKCLSNVGAAVLKLPALLAYSLERRIIPRVEALQANGLSVDDHLTRILQKTDDSFSKWVTRKTSSVSEATKLDGPLQPLASERIAHWIR